MYKWQNWVQKKQHIYKKLIQVKKKKRLSGGFFDSNKGQGRSISTKIITTHVYEMDLGS